MAAWHDYDDEATLERLKHRISPRTKARPSKGKGHRLHARIYRWKLARGARREA